MVNNLPYALGLTGGIATGKSTVADYLTRAYGWPILDADLYAREAVEPGSVILEAIAQRYGPSLLNSDGTLNRPQLGDIIFNTPKERQWLEDQIHPFVRERFEQEMRTLESPVVVLVIPLLFEAQMTDLVGEVWVVSCSPEQQLTRLQTRNQLSREAAQARIASQMPLDAKIALADVVIENNGQREHLQQEVDRIVSTRCYKFPQSCTSR
ncbi:dephospho-CoA kinase [Spirulina subsalsa FACHB-351]|uniref:Dephospho-CoA kinase n=1 Tax=Spirulina subsalsa FACHB-351 TaxID=234711 RepID=A0ABT3L6I8_9CYAN|nr:dephospho-CoA kinase [Spirulina subsalsa]MCW6036792.1 dephospho-CoA kinase [Spirulina subsalsa FACHB-351]